jgi:hypothetical protein
MTEEWKKRGDGYEFQWYLRGEDCKAKIPRRRRRGGAISRHLGLFPRISLSFRKR